MPVERTYKYAQKSFHRRCRQVGLMSGLEVAGLRDGQWDGEKDRKLTRIVQ
jgi:hypothetical protein